MPDLGDAAVRAIGSPLLLGDGTNGAAMSWTPLVGL
jgi:hypothetical protein